MIQAARTPSITTLISLGAVGLSLALNGCDLLKPPPARTPSDATVDVSRQGGEVCVAVRRDDSTGTSCTDSDQVEPMISTSGGIIVIVDPARSYARVDLVDDGRIDSSTFDHRGVVVLSESRRPDLARFYDLAGELRFEHDFTRP